MGATIAFNAAVRFFRLDHTCGLHSHYHDASKEFDSRVEERFFNAFQKHQPSSWTIHRASEVIDLGTTILIPDFTFLHNDGTKALMEIVGFWTPEYLEKKLSKLSEAATSNLIIAISTALKCSPTKLAGLHPSKIVFFKGALNVQDVLAQLDAIRCP